MRPVDALLLLCSHTAACAFGTMLALLWLPPSVPALMLGLAMGVLVTVIGFMVLELLRTAKGQ